MPPLPPPSDPLQSLLAEADRCVYCGLCLPRCPTYRLSRDEGESPRGRIALIQGLAAGRLAADAGLRRHLDRCLACRACEAGCPSRVRYGRLIAGARALPALRPRGWRHWPLRLLRAVLIRRPWRRALFRLARALPARLVGLIGPAVPPLQPAVGLLPIHPATGGQRGVVALFTGCLGDVLEQAAAQAAVRLLTRLGYTVHVPPGQGCCGALHRHAGDGAAARRLADANLAAFRRDYDAILHLSTGCGAELQGYGEWLEGAEGFAARVEEAAAFIAARAERLPLRPLAARAALHEPCSRRNVLRGGAEIAALLGRIPALEVTVLAENEQCCGGAGEYPLRRPETAAALRAPKLAATAALAPAYLVTTNLGCALHLAAGLREEGQAVEVIHPLVLAARQLEG